jgi:hypothetical protein
MIVRKAARVRLWSYALGTSVAAVAAASASPAAAQCSPDPTSAYGITNCAGTDADGLVVSTDYTRVTVASGAVVRPGAAAGAISFNALNGYLTVNGLVDGASKAGIAVMAGPAITVPCDPYAGASIGYCAPGSVQTGYPAASANVTVAAGGTVTGAQALLMTRATSNTTGNVSVSLTNAGTLTGTAGPALMNAAGSDSMLSVTNTATGRIEGISNATYVTNAGVIDGGTGTAIVVAPGPYSPGIGNTGRIISTGTAATVNATGTLSITNSTGAVLGGGTSAITTGGALTLTNDGTINGSIIVGGPGTGSDATNNSSIDTRKGIINGDLLLGAGDDMLRARFDTVSGRISSITGTVDGGAGRDTILLGIDSDSAIGYVVLPTNFELLGLELGNNATATLTPAFANAAGVGITVSGYGNLVNQADMTTVGRAIFANSTGYVLSIVNQANITATLNNINEGAVFSSSNLTNTGTITVVGGAGALANSKLENGGTIIASGTGAFISYGSFTNTGTIASTQGIGASIGNSEYAAASTNTGTITGATIGVNLSSGRFTNSGTISGGTTGVGLGYGAKLVNAEGGTINGGISGGTGFFGGNVGVANAGTINGSVDFSGLNSNGSNDLFVDAGGTVNGAIRLGAGDDQLVVDLISAADRPFAGATGGVDAGTGTDTLRYLVKADASTGLTLSNGFEKLAYELDNGAALTLQAAGGAGFPIGLTGNGTVTLEGTISTIGDVVVDATIATTGQLAYGTSGVTQALTIVNNGVLSMTKTDPYDYVQQGAIRAGAADVVNNGTITVINAEGSYYPASAILGGGSVTNAGSITLTGGSLGINGSRTVTNTGTIADTDAKGARGIVGVTLLDNAGTISVDGNAVELGYTNAAKAINRGTMESRAGVGVLLNSYDTTLINETTGTITGLTAVDISSGGRVINRGSIIGDVSGRGSFYGSVTYVADGGTLEGDLLLGSGNDIFVMTGTETGVSGTVDGGNGQNVFGYALAASGTASLDAGASFIGFRDAMVQTSGADTVATVTASDPFTGTLYVSGEGKIVNTAAINGNVITQTLYLEDNLQTAPLSTLASFENQGWISGSVSGSITNFVNTGTITEGNYPAYTGVSLSSDDAMAFTNAGTIAADVSLGGISIAANNSGTIASSDAYSTLSLELGNYYADTQASATLVNSGTISASLPEGSVRRSTAAVDIQGWRSDGVPIANAVVTNMQGATIGVEGAGGFGLRAYDAALTLDNAGTIRGTRAAVLTAGEGAVTIRNSGVLDGQVWLDTGNDYVENTGIITGPVLLEDGDDVFVQHAGATLGGLVDGGLGNDRFVIHASGDGSLDAGQITRFEQLSQSGVGTIAYSGNFEVGTIALEGGTLAVAAGQTLATAGPVTVSGGPAGVGVRNSGTIAGIVALGEGADTVVNTGTITGAILLGAGDDSYTEGAGSLAMNGVDGGMGTDLYRVALAGDRTGLGARSGFEQLAVEGNGTLALALDQNFESVALSGANLTAALGGFTIGRLEGSNAAEQVSIDGDVAVVSLGGGNDSLALKATTLAGRYDGGAGSDTLRLTAAGPVILTGSASGFENVSLTGGDLTVAGTLGTIGAVLTFEDGAQTLTVANAGTLIGAIDLGGGNDAFRLAAGGTLNGTVSGGAGTDTATLELANAYTLTSGILSDFEQLNTSGTGRLTLADGRHAFAVVNAAGSLSIASGASLDAGLVSFGPADNQMVVAGSFAGAVTGGAGSDTIEVSGNAAFSTVSGVEALRMSAGLTTISGQASLGSIALAGGRLIGFAGSTIGATTIQVAQGAVFGSAGTVNGNVTVAGTLSPGASPGIMTVNGNVALAGTSTSVFEITPAVSDRLVINGTLSIAQGATLEIVAGTAVTPGRSLDLITASGGITGSFTNVIKPASLFGFLVQDAGKITLMGQFLNDPAYSAQVRGAIDYLNTVLVSGAASSALIAAVPRLVTVSGASDQAAFALLTPEAYASASQIAVEQGLELAATGRSEAFAPHRETPGGFTFASALGSTRTLDSGASGTAKARTNGYGFLGGLGFADADWSIGGFVGYLDSRQTLFGRAARTDLDGIVAGIHARWSSDAGLGLKGTLAYSGGEATTRRSLPGGPGTNASARANYDLTGWTADVSVDYAARLGPNWTVRPSLGLTAIRVTRDGAVEDSGSPFALAIARDRDHAVFVDGALTFQGGQSKGAGLRPYLSLGVRYQVDGRAQHALAALGGSYGLEAVGAPRAPILATAAVGADLALSSRLTLFGTLSGEAGDADNRASARTGLRLTF